MDGASSGRRASDDSGLRAWAIRHPARAAALAGLVGGLLATYPLLLGRSVVSPVMGPVNMLYDQPPYSYGYDAPPPENVRGTDVGAMMWAHLPYTAVQRGALAEGEAPLWNRYNTVGEPLWGQGQTFILDPFHLASLAIPDRALAMDLRFVAARIVFATGIGVMVVAATGSWVAGVVMAALAPFVGHFTMRFNHAAYFSIVYAPWVLWAYVRLAQGSPRRRWAAAAWLAAATCLQMVGGTPKEGMMTAAAAHAAGLLAVIRERGGWSERLGRLDAALLGIVGGLLLSAPHWLIFLDTLSRSWTLSDRPMAIFANSADALAYALGPVVPGHPQTGVHALGLLAALLALASPTRLLGSGPGLGASVAALSFGAVALGAVPAGVLLEVPLISGIQHVGNTFLAATIVPVLLLGGFGIAWSLADAGPGAYRARAALGAATVALGVTALRTTPGQGPWIAALVLVLIAAAAALWVIGAGWRVGTSGALAFSLCALLSVAPGGLHLETGAAALDEILIQPRRRADLDEPSPAIAAIQAQAATAPYRVAPIELVLFPGTQALWGLEAIGGPDALRLASIETLSDLTLVERTPWLWLTVLHAATLESVRGFLDMVNVKYLVARRDQVPRGLRPLPSSGDDLLVAWERPSAWPRAFFVDGVEHHASLPDLAQRIRTATGPFASVDADDEGAVHDLPRTATRVVPAEDYRLTHNTTTFRIRSTGPGLAVLSEAWVEDDFRATLNGQPVPYLRVNHALKGVAIPHGGDWTVRFEYRPRYWVPAWILSGIGILVVAGLALATRLLERRSGSLGGGVPVSI